MRFYRLLGLDVPDPADRPDGHIDVDLGNGVRLMFYTEDVVCSFEEGWARTDGNQISLAFECDSPRKSTRCTRASSRPASRAGRSPGRVLGPTVRAGQRPDGVPVDLYASN